jgi:hypothetical protein
MIYHAGCVALQPRQTSKDLVGISSSRRVERTMKKIPNSSRRLSEHILRALNKIRKPSTASEITELLNRDLDLDDRPFQAKDVAEWLRNTEDTALTLYWSRARPRK